MGTFYNKSGNNVSYEAVGYEAVHNSKGADTTKPQGDGVIVDFGGTQLFVPVQNGKWNNDYNNIQTRDSNGNWQPTDASITPGTANALNAAVANAVADDPTLRTTSAPLPSARVDSHYRGDLKSKYGVPEASAQGHGRHVGHHVHKRHHLQHTV